MPNDFDKNPRDPAKADDKKGGPSTVGTKSPTPPPSPTVQPKKTARPVGDPPEDREKTTEELAEERRRARARDGSLDTRQNPQTGRHPDDESDGDEDAE